MACCEGHKNFLSLTANFLLCYIVIFMEYIPKPDFGSLESFVSSDYLFVRITRNCQINLKKSSLLLDIQ